MVGILKEGFRIAPSSAPISGSLYGKGAYFTDFFAKASQYCRSYISNNTGVVLLCQVALGESLKKSSIDSSAEKTVLESNGRFHSCEVVGSHQTDKSGAHHVTERVNKSAHRYEVPCGKHKQGKKGNIQYSEYVVYKEEQVRLKYLAMVKLI